MHAFAEAKSALAATTQLHHPLPDAELSLMVDASDHAVGAVLHQSVGSDPQPLAYFSKVLKPAETRYSTFGRELLAIYLAIKHFRHQLEGRGFHVFTDHKPLCFSFSSNSSTYSPRELRHLAFISEFTTDIRHVSGAANPVADALSRPSDVCTVVPAIDLATLANAQQCDLDLVKLRSAPSPGTSIQWSCRYVSPDTYLHGDISTGSFRPYVPASLREAVFNHLHNLAHPGTRSSVRLLTDSYFWPGIRKDVREFTRRCLACQQAKVHRHTKSSPSRFLTPGERFSVVHIDLVGPLPSCSGCTYLLTCIDRYTRWPEALPIPDSRTPTVARAFLLHWIARFGVPVTIISDRGAQFESSLWQELMQLLGSTRQRTTSYHPATNGLVERFHRHLKSALMARSGTQAPSEWFNDLPFVLLGIRTSVKSDLECSVAEMVYGSSLRLPGQFLDAAPPTAPMSPATLIQQLRSALSTLRPVPTSQRSNPVPVFVPMELSSASHVFIRRDSVRKSLQLPYDGPFPVLSRSEKYFTVKVNGRSDTVSIDRLKPAFV